MPTAPPVECHHCGNVIDDQNCLACPRCENPIEHRRVPNGTRQRIQLGAHRLIQRYKRWIPHVCLAISVLINFGLWLDLRSAKNRIMWQDQTIRDLMDHPAGVFESRREEQARLKRERDQLRLLEDIRDSLERRR